MAYIQKDEHYDVYRNLYLSNLQNGIFPWESAYYYYYLNMDRIDIKTFEQFKDDIMLHSSMCLSEEHVWDTISGPIYDTLEAYFNPVYLLTKTNEEQLILGYN